MRRMRIVVVIVLTLLAFPAAAAAQDPPAVETGEAKAVGQTTAALTGSVDPNGAETTYVFEYGTTEAYGLRTAERSAGAGTAAVAIEVPIERLTAATTYHYRLVATSPAGTVRSQDRTFRTDAPPANPQPPAAATGGARGVSPTGATLTGAVNPRGTATSYRFEFGTSTRYGARTPAQPAGAGSRTLPVGATIGGLAPTTRYHVRVVARNAAGVSRGRDRTFTTRSRPGALSLDLSAAAVVWGRPVTVSGRITRGRRSGVPVALEASAFPFAAGFVPVGSPVVTGSSGRFRFTVRHVWETTRLRAVTRTSPAVISRVATALSRVRVGARLRRLSRRRYRVRGSVWPATSGRVSLQRRTRRGRWVPVRRARLRRAATRSRYSFRVRRARTRRVYRAAVVPSDGGAHVRGTSREFAVRAIRRR